jgi:hypothetical protein
MPKICYRPVDFKPSSLAKIKQANEIIAEYGKAGYELTLRQLYYQFVARDLIPNTPKSYDNLGELINNARLAGLVDWHAIIDRTRNLSKVSTWESPRDIVQACASQFRYDLWKDQDNYVEVWVEKDALGGIVDRACQTYRVPWFSCRGYTSQSEMWSAAQRLKGHILQGQTCVVIHLGDHDPSGIDMTRDVEGRLHEFARTTQIEVRRIALNMDQVQQYGPPPNPAKVTDSRYASYQAEHGDESWELDALEPSVIDALIQKEVESLVDADTWQEGVDREENAKEAIEKLALQLSND